MVYNDLLKLTQTDVAQLVEAMKASKLAMADSFGRERSSLPYQELDIKFNHDLSPGTMTQVTAGTGAVAIVAGKSYATLTVSAANDKATLRTRVPMRYRAGQSLETIMTFVMADPATGLTYRVGYFNESDGLFFQKTGTSGLVSFVIRSSIDTTETEIAQADWSIDPMDGTGPSGVTLNWTKDILFIMDLQFLGIGQVRFGFVVGGCVCWAHWEDFSNQGTTAYMASANLHLAYQIDAGASFVADPTTLRAICGTVIREGGNEEPTSKHVASTALGTNATPASNTWESVVSVRVKDLYKPHSTALPGALAVYCTSAQSVAWRVMRLSHTDVPIAITGGVWADVGPESICEYSVVEAAIDITKGKTFDLGYAASSNQVRGSLNASLFDTDGVGLDASDNQDVLILACAGIGGAGAIQADLQVVESR